MLEQMLMMQLQRNNPQMYTRLLQLRNSGKSPEEILNMMLANGQVTEAQLKQAQTYLNNQQGGSNNNPTNNTGNGYNGF